jgi:thiosulfate/3-mercaptopyruvate sulfurtransferase
MVKEYANPEVLVTTEWVSEHLDDPGIRIVESDEDVILYELGHVPGAVKVDWHTELQDQLIRDYVNAGAFEQLVSEKGIGNDHTVVFYGDKSNWWATYAFWVFKLFGHENCRIMDGGRQKWIDEGREFTKEVPKHPSTTYKVASINEEAIRAFRKDVANHIEANRPLVDVRSTKEYTGELLHMEEYPQEGALRGGHIPGAASIPWGTAVNEDQTFKSAGELWSIYNEQNNLKPEEDIIAYCRIGERSSHTWFVLTYLLGYPSVRNYDGSWTEWGNLVRAPIERP